MSEEEADLRSLKQTAIRFTDRDRKMILKARTFRGQTFQTFGRTAILREAAVVLEQIAQEAKQKPQERRQVSGLGIRERLNQQRAEATEAGLIADLPSPAPSQTVTVRVEAPAAPGSIDVASLAREIVAAPRKDRKQWLESACMKIKKAARSSDEMVRLAEQLDEEIQKLENRPGSVLDRVRARRASR